MKETINLQHLLKRREIWGDEESRKLENVKHVTPEFVDRLGLSKELEGHEGCVNCLEWNRSGDILASGSDDQTVILWHGQTGEKLHQLSTDHQGNIFSVKFIPQSSDNTIVTGSQDSRVCLLDVNKQCSVQCASLSRGRVKRLAVSEETSGIFWSASEDGTVMQWDTREKWSESTVNVLVDLNAHCARAEVKCIAVNPVRDNIIAIGANDQFIRLYDRRKLSLKKISSRQDRNYRLGCYDDQTPPDAVKYLVPGHLAGLDTTRSSVRSYFRPLTTTYLAFSSRGSELVVNMGGDHVYLFDNDSLFGSAQQPSVQQTLELIQQYSQPSTSSTRTPGKLVNGGVAHRATDLSKEADLIKLRANSEYERGNYIEALKFYNSALAKDRHPILYGNRAAALMKRKFTGDTYAASRDCITTLNMNPGHIKALLRLAKCLQELERHEEARMCLDIFKARYPDHAKSSVCQQLEKDISAAEAERSSVMEDDKEDTKKEEDEEGRESPMDTSEQETIRVSDAGGNNHRRGEEEGGQRVREGRQRRGEEGEIGGRGSRSDTNARNGKVFSEQEIKWRSVAADYLARYVGACNTSTDIKEANFFGNDNQFIMSGSDDGKIFIWDTKSTNLVKVLSADSSTVNCVQAHPNLPLIASSGIESLIRIWQPRPEDGEEEAREVKTIEKVIKENQDRMTQDPFEYFISNDQIRDTDLQCRTS